MTNRTRVFAARWIFPLASPPIHGGWVRVNRQQIVEVDQGRPPPGAEDLGDVALLPGLVNAHTHLEFSDCELPIGEPGTPLYQWIGQVMAARAATTSESKTHAIRQGLRESAAAGVSLIGEIATLPCDYPAAGECVAPSGRPVPSEGSESNERRAGASACPELVTFAETIGLSAPRGEERIEAAKRHLEQQPRGAISPHAPYSTSRSLIERCVAMARQFDRPLAMHVAESPEERELLCNASGPFAEALQQLGVWNQTLFPWQPQPMQWLITQLAKAPRALLIHGNDLRTEEIAKLAEHPTLSVVYCPRTHAFFAHREHPVQRLLQRGVRVALGTDSRASNPDLNLWREVQFLLRHRQDLDPQAVLEMGTIAGADALGHRRHGRLQPGAPAQLNRVMTTANTLAGVYRDLAENRLSRVD
ncbi:MAG: amidohydrolase family protein [Novipirellula sp. JB048]